MKSFIEYINEEKTVEAEIKAFTKTNINISRRDMPQIKSAYFEDFKKWLKTEKIKTTVKDIPAKSLKATQKNLNADTVKIVVDKGNKDSRPVLTTKDGYVLDGHHRVLGARIKDQSIKAIIIDLNIKQALEKLRTFPDVKYYSESVLITERVVNSLLRKNKDVIDYVKNKASNRLDSKSEEEAIKSIYKAVLPDLNKRDRELKNTLQKLSKKYKNTDIKTRVKPLDSVISKVVKRGKSLADAPDLIGGMIITQSSEDAESVAKDIQRKMRSNILSFEKKTTGGNNRAGYQGAYHIDLDYDGITAEIQIFSKGVYKKKALAHKIYTATRDTGASEHELAMSRKLFAQGVRESLEESTEDEIVDSLMQLSEEILQETLNNLLT